MVRGDTEEVNRHLNKMNKDSIICLLREAISQMSTDRERGIRSKELVLEVKKVIRDSFIENNDQVPSEELVNGVKSAVEQAVTNCRVENTGGTAFAAPVPAPLRQPMESHQHQIRINGILESDSKIRTEVLNYQSGEFNKVMKFLGEVPTITDIKRLGRPSPDNNRPGTLLITFHNPWDVRKVLAKAATLKEYKERKVFISKSMNRDERQIEDQLLKKRRELINNNVNPRAIKIKFPRLFVDDK